MRTKQSVLIVILFFILIISNNAQGMTAQPPLRCNYIIYDIDKNITQMSMEIYEEGWILNWSKYDLYISKERGKIYPDEQVEIPTTIGTLAYNEIHYINCSNVVSNETINKSVWIKLVKADTTSTIWRQNIIIISGIIENDFTLIDDYDNGREIEDWGKPNPDFIKNAASAYVIISFIPFFTVIMTIIHNTNRGKKMEIGINERNDEALLKNQSKLLYFALLTQIIIMIPSIIIITLFLSSNDYISLLSSPPSYPVLAAIISVSLLSGSLMSLFLLYFSADYSLQYRPILSVIGLINLILCIAIPLYYGVS